MYISGIIIDNIVTYLFMSSR